MLIFQLGDEGVNAILICLNQLETKKEKCTDVSHLIGKLELIEAAVS